MKIDDFQVQFSIQGYVLSSLSDFSFASILTCKTFWVYLSTATEFINRGVFLLRPNFGTCQNNSRFSPLQHAPNALGTEFRDW